MGINTFAHFLGTPWYDNQNDEVSDAVVISYVSGNPSTVPAGSSYIDRSFSVGGNTPLPINYTFSMFEYAWQPGTIYPNPGPGLSSGYYIGTITNPIIECYHVHECPYYSGTYYYTGSGQACNFLVVPWGLSVLVICTNIHTEYFFGYVNSSSSDVKSSSNYIPFAPLDQQNNPDYKYFGIFYTYYWFTPDQQNSNNLDVYFPC